MDRIQRDFERFHLENPWVYEKLVALARQYLARGRRVGIKHLWEVLRWHAFHDTVDEASEWKLCNNYHSRYARRIMEQEPELDGFFELRELQSLEGQLELPW